MTNNPKVLVEFSPEEIAWLADRLHEEWMRTVNAGKIAMGENAEKVRRHQEMQNTLRNRILNSASKQGFGEL